MKLDITPEMLEAGRKQIAGSMTDFIEAGAADQILINVYSSMLAVWLESELTSRTATNEGGSTQ